jgi:tetratricopeptide (TPR) repeat protein
MEHPGIMTHRAQLEAMGGRIDEARALNARAEHIFIEVMHAPRMLMFLAESQATVEALAGDHEAAARALRSRLELARENGEPYYVSQTAARLALVLRTIGLADEASTCARLSAESAPVEGVAEQALSRIALAGIAWDGGDHVAAVRLAREAISIAPEEMPNLRADVLTEAASILRVSDAQAATEAEAEAARLYELKGNVVARSRWVR